jgi:collagenase-like PrtC family protease
MAVSIATTFDKKLIDSFVEINLQQPDEKFRINETYGCMITSFGSGRNSFRLPNITYDALKEYIDYSLDKGIGFNYLLNTSCYSGRELSKKFVIELCSHVEELMGLNPSIFTVANPFVMKILKDNFKEIKINSSINSRIRSLEEVVRFLDLGIDRLTVHYDLNRDFEKLRKIRKKTDIPIELLSNNPCLYKCIYADSHLNMDSHGSTSSEENQEVNTLAAACNCKNIRLHSPAEIIKVRWIRPSDMHTYFNECMDILKIAGRNMDDTWLKNAAKSYVLGIEKPDFYVSLIERGKWKYVTKKNKELEDLTVSLNLPDDFLEWFTSGKCKDDCSKCSHCQQTAEKYVKFNSDELRQKYLRASEEIVAKQFSRD